MVIGMAGKIAAFFLAVLAYFFLLIPSPAIAETVQTVSALPPKKKKTANQTKTAKKAVNEGYLAVRQGKTDYVKELQEYQTSFSAQMKAYYDNIVARITPATKWSLVVPGKSMDYYKDKYNGIYPSTYNLNEAVKFFADNAPNYYGTKPIYNPPVYKG